MVVGSVVVPLQFPFFMQVVPVGHPHLWQLSSSWLLLQYFGWLFEHCPWGVPSEQVSVGVVVGCGVVRAALHSFNVSNVRSPRYMNDPQNCLYPHSVLSLSNQ